MVIFFLGVLIIYTLLVVYIGWNGWVWITLFIRNRKPLKFLYWFILVLVSYSFVFGRILEESPILAWIGGIWIGFFCYILLLMPFVNLFVFFTKYTKIPKEKAKKWAGIITLTTVSCLFVYGLYNAFTPVVRNYEITIPKKIEGKKSLNIVMASDMHFGDLSGANQAKKLVKNINALNPDLVLFPGDIIDDNIEPFLRRGIPDILKEIKAPVYASMGNHDREEDKDVDLVQIFNESGMRMLDDEVVVLDNGLTIIGRKDRGYRDVVRAKLADLMKNVDVSKPNILLDHQPYDLDIAEKNNIDLLVAGHTHRGQIAPAHLITKRIYENDWGYLKKGNLHTIVSSGYGFWGTPLRIGSQSEIVQIKITFQP